MSLLTRPNRRGSGVEDGGGGWRQERKTRRRKSSRKRDGEVESGSGGEIRRGREDDGRGGRDDRARCRSSRRRTRRLRRVVERRIGRRRHRRRLRRRLRPLFVVVQTPRPECGRPFVIQAQNLPHATIRYRRIGAQGEPVGDGDTNMEKNELQVI